MATRFFLLITMVFTVSSAFAFDPLIGQVNRDPTREIGVYQDEFDRSKRDHLDRIQRLSDNSDSMNQELFKAEPNENGKAMGQ